MPMQWTHRVQTADPPAQPAIAAWLADMQPSEQDMRTARRWLLVTAIPALLAELYLPRSAAWAIGPLVGIDLVFWGMRAVVTEGVLARVLAR